MRSIGMPRLAFFVMLPFMMAGMTAAIGVPGIAQAVDQPTASPLVGQVDVGQVSGGSQSRMAWRGFVRSSLFAEILEDALKERGLSGNGGGRFVVSAEMLEFKWTDELGRNFEGFASASVLYRVTSARDKAVIFETLIHNTVGVKATRDPGRPSTMLPSVRLAPERKAVSKNISKFLDALMEQAKKGPAFRPAN